MIMDKEGSEKEISRERLRKQENKAMGKWEKENRKVGKQNEIRVSREIDYMEEIKKEFKKFREEIRMKIRNFKENWGIEMKTKGEAWIEMKRAGKKEKSRERTVGLEEREK